MSTLYYWDMTLNGLGHLSLQLDAEKYISHWPDTTAYVVIKQAKPPNGMTLALDEEAEGREADGILEIPHQLLDLVKMQAWWRDQYPKFYDLFDTNCAKVVSLAIRAGISSGHWGNKFDFTGLTTPRAVYSFMRQIVWLFHGSLSSRQLCWSPPCSSGPQSGSVPMKMTQVTDKDDLCLIFVTNFVREVLKDSNPASKPPHDQQQIPENAVQKGNRRLFQSLTSIQFLSTAPVTIRELMEMEAKFETMQDKSFSKNHHQDLWTLQLISEGYLLFQTYKNVYMSLHKGRKRFAQISITNFLTQVAQRVAQIYRLHGEKEKACDGPCGSLHWSQNEMRDLDQFHGLSLLRLHVEPSAVFRGFVEQSSDHDSDQDTVWSSRDYVELTKKEKTNVKKKQERTIRAPFPSEWDTLRAAVDRRSKMDQAMEMGTCEEGGNENLGARTITTGAKSYKLSDKGDFDPGQLNLLTSKCLNRGTLKFLHNSIFPNTTSPMSTELLDELIQISETMNQMSQSIQSQLSNTSHQVVSLNVDTVCFMSIEYFLATQTSTEEGGREDEILVRSVLEHMALFPDNSCQQFVVQVIHPLVIVAEEEEDEEDDEDEEEKPRINLKEIVKDKIYQCLLLLKNRSWLILDTLMPGGQNINTSMVRIPGDVQEATIQNLTSAGRLSQIRTNLRARCNEVMWASEQEAWEAERKNLIEYLDLTYPSIV